jgi:hypothetical protein
MLTKIYSMQVANLKTRESKQIQSYCEWFYVDIIDTTKPGYSISREPLQTSKGDEISNPSNLFLPMGSILPVGRTVVQCIIYVEFKLES